MENPGCPDWYKAQDTRLESVSKNDTVLDSSRMGKGFEKAREKDIVKEDTELKLKEEDMFNDEAEMATAPEAGCYPLC